MKVIKTIEDSSTVTVEDVREWARQLEISNVPKREYKVYMWFNSLKSFNIFFKKFNKLVINTYKNERST